MYICGVQKLSMVDFPGKLAATVFTGGCNLRCPYCHNALLVTRLDESPSIPVQEVLDFLSSRRKLLDGVVLSGGEPLLQPDAVEFLRRVREMDFAIKVDTNGCRPQVLEQILTEGLADYVAMDIKNRPEKYPETVGIPNFDLAPILESIRLLQQSGVDYEFRTTVVREFHTPDDIAAAARWIQGAPRYFLQHFEDSGNLISSGLHAVEREEMEQMRLQALPFVPNTALRGL